MEENIHEQVEDNSPSIERILCPISYTSWLLGVGIAHPRKCPKTITIIIRIIHMAACLYSLIDVLLYITSVHIENMILYYIDLLIDLTCYVSTYYNIYCGIRLYNKWPELMDKLKELDQKIKKEISINNRSIKIIKALIAIFTAFCSLMLIIEILYIYVSYSIFPVGFVLFFYLVMQSLINSFVFDVIVYILYCRFQTINELIGQLDKLSNVQWITFKIRCIRELHADICDLASMVNDIHSLYLFFCSASCFTMAVSTLFNVYIFREIITKMWIISWLRIVYVMQFCLICWICTLTCEESNRTGRIIHKIILNCKPINLDKNKASNQSSVDVQPSLEDSNVEQNSNSSSSHNLNYVVLENLLHKHLDQDCVRNEVNDFSAQLQQNRVAFTVCNFFELNNASLGCFVGIIFTYLVIFVQLYQQPKS